MLAALESRPETAGPRRWTFGKQRLLGIVAAARVGARYRQSVGTVEELAEAARGVVDGRINPYEFVDDVMKKAGVDE